MSVPGIPSKEVFGNVSASLGEAPKHTEEGHERCAYYVTSEIRGDDELDMDDPMICPHGMASSGAFYSEDYVKQLVVASQKLVTEAMELPLMHVPTWFRSAVDRVKELVDGF